MERFDRAIKTVLKLVAKNGQTVTFKHTNQSVPNVNEPWNMVESLPNTQDIKMVFLSPSSNSQVGKELLQYLTGTSVPTGKIRGYCGPFNYVPKLNDVFIRNGQTLIISAVDTLSPNGQTIMYIVEFAL